MTEKPAQIVMEEITDPEELAKARAQRARFDRNTAWLQAHAAEVYARYRGKCICIAGAELFVADTPEEVLALAKAAHPDDDGFFLHYIPRDPARESGPHLCKLMENGLSVTMASCVLSSEVRFWPPMVPGCQYPSF
jgi:hypothetical protein